MAGFSGSLGSIWVEIGARIDDFKKGMAQIEPSIKNTLQQMEGLAKIGDTMSDVGKKLTLGLTTPIVAFAGYALKASGDFDTAMRLVSARGDITGESLAKLKKQAEDLGAATQFSSKQAAEGMAEFAGAGFKTDEIYSAMPGVMSLAAAATTSVGEASKITKDALGQFGLAASDSTKAADLLAKAGNLSSGSIQAMATTLTYVGPVAKAAGLNMEQTAAAILVLDKAGIRGSEAGTALRTVLTNLQAPSDKAAKLMQQLGIHVIDTHGKLLPLPQAIEQVTGGLAKLQGPAERSGALVTLFGKEALAAANALVQQGAPAMAGFETQLHSVGGEADRTAKVMNSGFGGALEKMKGSIETAAQKIGDLLAPAAITLAGAVETAANKLAEFAGWFAKLPEPIQATALGMVALLAALGPVLVIAGQMTTAFAAVISGLAVMAPQALLASEAVTKLGLAKAGVATIASNLLAPALIAVSAALVGMQVVQVTGAFGDLLSTMEGGIKTVSGNKDIFTNFASALTSVFTEAGKANTGLSSINFPKVGADAKAAGSDTGYLSDMLSRLQSIIGNFKWTDFLTPLGAVRNQIVSLTDGIRTLTGYFPSMEKAGADALGKLQDANRTSMRAAADHAMAVVTLGKQHQQLKTVMDAGAKSVKTMSDGLNQSAKAASSTNEAVKPLHFSMDILNEKIKEEADARKKGIEELVKWKNAHQDEASITPQLIDVNDELTASIQNMVSQAKLVGPAFEANTSAIEDAATRMQKLDEAYKISGATNIHALEEQAAKAKEAYEAIAQDADAALGAAGEAWDNYQKKQAAVIKASSGELTEAQADSLEEMKTQVEDHGKEQESAWKGIMQQVSTIITDAGKGIIDKFLNMGEYNKKLDEQASTLRSSLADREQTYQDFAASVQQSLDEANAGYQDTIQKEAQQLHDNLEERKADYDDYVKQIAGKLDEVRTKHAKEEEKERKDILDSLDDRTQDYEDYQGDIKDKIGKIRDDSAKSQDKERKDLVGALADKKLDYDRYVEDVQTKLVRIRDKNKGQYSDEEADLIKSLQRRAEDFQSYQAENLATQQGLAAKYAASQAAEEAELQKSLDRKTRDFQEYQDDIKSKLDEVAVKHQEEQAKEESDLQASLDRKRAELDKYTADATEKAEAVNAAARDKLDKQTTDLHEKLANQTAEWENYKTSVTKQLDEIESKHRGIFGSILAVGQSVFSELGVAVGRFVSEQLIGMLFKQLGNLVDDILPSVGKALDGVMGKLGGLSKGVSDVAGDAGTAAAGGAQAGTGAAGSSGGAAGQAAGSITGLVGAIGSVAGAVSGVISNFQNAHQETSLNAIEHNTRYSMMYLGERGDGGILGRLFDISDKTQYLPGLLDGINLKMDNWLQPLNGTLSLVTDRVDIAISKLGEVSNNTLWGSKAEGESNFKFDAMLVELRNIAAKDLSVVVNVSNSGGTTTSNVKLAGLSAI